MALALALLLALCLPEEEALLALRAESRHAREAAVRALAAGDLTAAALAAHLDDADLRVALGVAEALRERGDPAALPFLAAAAGHADPERGEAAARAFAELSLDCGREVGEGGGEGLAAARLRAAARAAAFDHVARTEAWRAADQPQRYRRLLEGGPCVGAALAELAADPRAAAARRLVAVAALARFAGEAAVPTLVPLLEDPDPDVRAHAAAALLATGGEEAYAAVAALLGRAAAEEPELRGRAIAAVQRGGAPSPEGVAQLLRLVQVGPAHLAVEAAAALRRADAGRAGAVVEARVRAFLASGRKVAGADLAGGLLLLRAGPVPREVEEACRASGEALVRLCATPGREEALAGLRELLAPDRRTAARETYRVAIAGALLRRHAAPWADRVAFAGPLLASDAPPVRAGAAALLEGAPAAEIAALRPALEELLDDPNESVRVPAAAALAALAPVRALPVLADALRDGDAHAAAVALRALRACGRAPPEALTWRSAPAERRAFARALSRELSGKE